MPGCPAIRNSAPPSWRISSGVHGWLSETRKMAPRWLSTPLCPGGAGVKRRPTDPSDLAPAKTPIASSRRGSVIADQHAGLGRRACDQLERAGLAVGRQQPLPTAEQDRLDHQPVLVDEIVADELLRKRGTAHDLDGAALA